MSSDVPVFRQLFWPTPLSVDPVIRMLGTWAQDELVHCVVLETRADGAGVEWLVGAPLKQLSRVLDAAKSSVSGLAVSAKDVPVERDALQTARRLRLTTTHAPIDGDPEATARAVFGAFGRVRHGEKLVLQVVLGPHRRSLSVPVSTGTAAVTPWWRLLLSGSRKLDPERRRALQSKVGSYGFDLAIRIGVTAETPARRQSLVTSLYGALRSSDSAAAHLTIAAERPEPLNAARLPRRRLTLNVVELSALIGAPIGEDLPGLPSGHPKIVAPLTPAKKDDLIVAEATAGGAGLLGYGVKDASQHTWVLGPNGTGKSTLLENLAVQHFQRGHAVVVIEPKDVVTNLLSRIPTERLDDVVLLDAADPDALLGFNPLATDGRSADLAADTVLGTFHALYADSWGPRTADILNNALLSLTRAGNASLVMLPLILTNERFRRDLLKRPGVLDPIATGPFWAWYDRLSDAERAQVIAPVMNKVRPWLIRPGFRSVIAQTKPKITVRQIIEQKKILLVPASKGLLGPETAQLLAALVLSELWQAIRERVSLPAAQRHPIAVFVDEVQDFLRLPTDLADVLATSRSLGAQFYLAHQFRDQLPPSMKSAFESNARSRVAFQLTAADAKAMSQGQKVLSPDDFTSLPAYSIYAALMRDGQLMPWASGRTLPPPPVTSKPDDVRRRSQAAYARPVAEVEGELLSLLDDPSPEASAPSARVRRNRT